jgi:hypothetical protein
MRTAWIFYGFVCVLAVGYHLAIFVVLALYELRIKNHRGETLVEEKSFRTNRFAFAAGEKFDWVRFANGPQNSVIRASSGMEFGALLSDRQKEKITNYLNVKSQIVVERD